MKVLSAFFCTMLTALTAFSAPEIQISGADIILEAKNIKAWGIKVFSGDRLAQGFISCRPVSELPGKTFACLSVGRSSHLAAVLGPASIFAEGNLGYSRGTLIDRTKPDFISKLNHSDVGGYNLKGEDLREFIKQSKVSCDGGNVGHCLSEAESSFFGSIEESLQSESFNLIAVVFFPMTMGDSYISVLNHESLHVIYFRDDEYRTKVEKFWEEVVTADDKKAILEILKSGYDIQSEYVVINEFQAYILQQDSEQSLLSAFVTKYKDKLSAALSFARYPSSSERDLNLVGGNYLIAPDYLPQRAVIIDGTALKIGGNMQPHYQLDFINELLASGMDILVLAGDRSPLWMEDLESNLGRAGFNWNAEALNRIHLVDSPGGSQWARDYSPLHLVSRNQSPQHLIVDFKYQNVMNPIGDQIPQGLASAGVGLDALVTLPIEMEGGNFLCNSRICLTSDKLLEKNSEKFGDAEKLQNLFRKLSKQKLVILPSLPYEGNRHVDMYTAFLDDETLLVGEISDRAIEELKDPKKREKASEVQAKLENLAQILKERLISLSPQTKIVRFPMPAPLIADRYAPLFRSYTNFLLVNTANTRRVIVPSYASEDCNKSKFEDQCSIPALEKRIESILHAQGYKVSWVNALGIIPWQGSLHCTTANVPTW